MRALDEDSRYSDGYKSGELGHLPTGKWGTTLGQYATEDSCLAWRAGYMDGLGDFSHMELLSTYRLWEEAQKRDHIVREMSPWDFGHILENYSNDRS